MNGHVTSFEVSKWRYHQAMRNIKSADLSKFVTLIHDNPITAKSKIPKKIDFVFLDAEKEDYIFHFENIFDKIVDGGLIVADNTISHEDILKGYIDYVRSHNNCNSAAVSIGRGLELTYKLQKNNKSIAWNTLI